MAVYPVRTLTEVVEFINGTRLIDPVRSDLHFEHQESQHRTEDFRDVRGHYPVLGLTNSVSASYIAIDLFRDANLNPVLPVLGPLILTW